MKKKSNNIVLELRSWHMSLIELHSQWEEAAGPSEVCWLDLLSCASGIHHVWRGLSPMSRFSPGQTSDK